MASLHQKGRELYVTESLERRLLLAAHPTLVKDINQTTDTLNPGAVTVSNGIGYFAGRNG